jgi:hypothetical protein
VGKAGSITNASTPSGSVGNRSKTRLFIHLVAGCVKCFHLGCSCLPGIFFLKNSKADWYKTPDVVKAKTPDVVKAKQSDQDQAAVQPSYKIPGFACPLRRSHGTEVGLLCRAQRWFGCCIGHGVSVQHLPGAAVVHALHRLL